MPGYRTHLLAGCGSFLLLASVLEVELQTDTPLLPLWYGGLSLLGSIFPDIDVASKMQRLFFKCSLLAAPLLLLTNRHSWFLGLSFLVLFVVLLRHRTLTHQVGFAVGMPLLLAAFLVYSYQIPSYFSLNSAFFFIGGCLSHIMLDRSLTAIKNFFSKRH